MAKKPNILILWGDDIGQFNLSCYSHGVMGYHTPNIDRLAKEGVLFTDYYAEQSCTAGRASFITGQAGLRTGLTKVGTPGAELGMQAANPTIDRVMKHQGYRTGQFGKNHLATVTSIYQLCMASTNSSAISFTSTPKKNRNCATIRRKRTFPISASSTARAQQMLWAVGSSSIERNLR